MCVWVIGVMMMWFVSGRLDRLKEVNSLFIVVFLMGV